VKTAVPPVRTETAAVAKTLNATAYGVGGEAPAFYDISAISDSDLARVVPVAIVVIGLLLCLVIRSLIAPLYLIASVALSFFAALGQFRPHSKHSEVTCVAVVSQGSMCWPYVRAGLGWLRPSCVRSRAQHRLGAGLRDRVQLCAGSGA
jgi:MMPL family